MNLNDGSHRTTNNLKFIRSSSSQRTRLNSHNLITNLDIRSNWESTFNLGCNCRCTIRAYYTEGVITNFDSLRRIQNIIIIEGVKSSSNKLTQTISRSIVIRQCVLHKLSSTADCFCCIDCECCSSCTINQEVS